MITALEGLALPVGLSFMLTPAFKMQGIMAAMIASEAVTTAFIIGFLLYDRQRSRTSEERIFLLPKTDDTELYEFSVRMDIKEIVEKAAAVSHYIEEKTDHSTANVVCLALEEMLTGIAMANDDPDEIIDVALRETENDIIISIRDMGVGFDPTMQDDTLVYDFDNAMILRSIASEIKYDLSLGMNDTMIRLPKRM